MDESSLNEETLKRVAFVDRARHFHGYPSHEAALDAGQYGKVLETAAHIAADPARAESAIAHFTNRLKRRPAQTERETGVPGIASRVR